MNFLDVDHLHRVIFLPVQSRTDSLNSSLHIIVRYDKVIVYLKMTICRKNQKHLLYSVIFSNMAI